MNPSAHQSPQAPAQKSRRHTAQRDVTLRSAHSHPRPVDRRLFGQEARRCEATQDQTRLRCEATHYLLPTDIANAWDRNGKGKNKDTLPILFTSFALRHPLTLHTTPTSFARGCPLFYPFCCPFFFLVCGPSAALIRCCEMQICHRRICILHSVYDAMPWISPCILPPG
ncbi:hypothetical protein F5Y06DRAFT_28122 [Hypoxylon sp. FL0890]|nr:hypothetical protein F5Y06DRAFT_28122 [Hypoxylon sp. FL0890]